MATSQEKDDLLNVDITRLEHDAAGQARRLREWSDKLARAEKEAKLAKNALRVVKAELSKAVRSAPGKYQIVKITEDSVEDIVVCMSTYKDAFGLLVDTDYNRDLVKAMVISLHERGEQIGNEVKMHGQQYFATPKVDPETYRGIKSSEREEVMRETTQTLNHKKGRKE